MALEIVTHGCRLNLVESEAIRARAEAAGLSDLAIVNSCAVTGEAVRQARRAVRRLAREVPGRPVIVTGCAAQIDPAGFAALPGAAAVIGNAEKLEAESWAALARGETPAAGDIMARRTLSVPEAPRAGGRTRAFLQIQNGCDHRCTFCVIPFGRGNSRSVRPDEAIARARTLVAQGAREIVLTGVDLTAYGRDLDGAPTLGDLVVALLAALPELARLRLSSIDAVEADATLLAALAGEPRLMPHLHVSLQAGHDLTLKRMKRRHSREQAVRFCADLRRARPGIAFGADLIAGFPTETEAMFQATLDLIGDCGLSYVHVFPFSPRPGTPAARMPQLPGELVAERAARLRERAQAAHAAHVASRIGRPLAVLSEHGGTGRAEDFTPVRFAHPPAPGLLLPVTASASDGRALLAA